MAAWRGDGKELFYLSADHHMMAVDVELKPAFRAGAPRALFPVNLFGIVTGRNSYTVTKDGNRFLIYTPAPQGETDPVNVVVHWPALMDAR